ncbi:MAG: sigma-70 family RNA polymerase sigma factor, partial [Planctomycetia bacterium]|nr:sigma-70 family RNA polymerase sigma factor [Planctomycetia bacterium]
EDERQLRWAIARLSEEHREVLILKDLEGMKYEEIAEVLGVPLGTIRSRLHRARLELRDLLVPADERAALPAELPEEQASAPEPAEMKQEVKPEPKQEPQQEPQAPQTRPARRRVD